ncbi:ribonuclease T2 family protein [Peteryoungia ipomoeae]|uniref:Ribonuclease T(2) n=1 Tax=Peteryoungia ipomoeae TaxID=1210932 RepID=A0A4S8P7Z9_9HYPH|nr:ribonuclease T(2) [Peteryoungia ipomoeae]THV25655.1 ribonuclease T(2) [Peteryoungia ipomoeae]
MGRYTGLFAFGLFLAAAAVYGLLPADAPMDRPSPTDTSQATPGPMARAPSPTAKPADPPRGKGFDFYVLALSWSPTFCESEAAARNQDQCGDGKSFGWIVHGLWPQNEKGWPENCATPEGGRVPHAIGRDLLDIMPSMGLIGHQWRKHGSCSGLGKRDYFNLVRQASDKIQIPPEYLEPDTLLRVSPAAIEQSFIRANPGLARSGIAVTCEREKIDEIRICLDTGLGFRACPEVDSRSCRRTEIAIPPAR